MQPLENCIGPTIRIGREIQCLPYAGFFLVFMLLGLIVFGNKSLGTPFLSLCLAKLNVKDFLLILRDSSNISSKSSS